MMIRMLVCAVIVLFGAQNLRAQVPCVWTFYDVHYQESCAGNYGIPNLPPDQDNACVVDPRNSCSSNSDCIIAGRSYVTYIPNNQNDWTGLHDYYANEGNDLFLTKIQRKTYQCYVITNCKICLVAPESSFKYCLSGYASSKDIPDDVICP